MIGIHSYGFYVPQYRIKIEEIAKIWGKRPEDIISSLQINEKSVGGPDEDTLTMAYEAASMAFSKSGVDPKKIGVVFVGSETHPYVVNPTSTTLAEYLGVGNDYLAFDTQFACKAATGAMIAAFGLIKSGFSKYALVAGADKASGRPHDALEYSAGSAACALILGAGDVVLELLDYVSFSSDTPDFWRREGIRYPSHSGRFTGKPSYFYHITEATRKLLAKSRLTVEQIDHAVFHMPNGKFPQAVGAQLGFTKKQLKQSLVVTQLGNSYAAAALVGLASVLDEARDGDLISLVSYGSGAGSDGFIFRATKYLKERKQHFKASISKKSYVDYPTYLKFMKTI